MKNKSKFIFVSLILLCLMVSLGAAYADSGAINEDESLGSVDSDVSMPSSTEELSNDIPEVINEVESDSVSAESSNAVGADKIGASDEPSVGDDPVYTDVYVSPDGTGTGASAEDPTNFTQAVSALASNTKIHVLDGTYVATKTSNEQFQIKANNTCIIAENPGNVELNGNDKCRFFKILGANVTLDGLVFTHGKGVGGIVYYDSDANGGHIVNCIFRDSNHTSNGGALYTQAPNLLVEKCTFINTTATGSTGGGAIYIQANNVTVMDCSFENCTALRAGGAIRWTKDNGVILNSNFTNCNGTVGGAVAWDGINGKIANCTFINNTVNSTNSNAPHHMGGAVYWNGDYGIIDNCTFINNTAPFNGNNMGGGAVYWGYTSKSSVNGTVMNCIFEKNSADKDGGAIYWFTYGEGRVINCSFESNEAGNMGGAIYWRGDDSHLLYSNFTNNHAELNGGAVSVSFNINNNFDLAHCRFENNTAETLNYTIHNAGKLFLENNTIDGVPAIYNNGSITSLVKVYVVVNENDPFESNVAYYSLNDDAPIWVYILDNDANLINGDSLKLTIGDTEITEFEMEDGAYKTIFKITEYGTYFVNASYTRAESPIVYGGTIVAEEPIHSAHVSFVSEYENTCYAGTVNNIEIHVLNNGSFNTNYTVDFYVDGVKVNSSEVTIPIGQERYLTICDEKIRPVNEYTVLGENNPTANYTVIVSNKDSGEVLTEASIFPAILYNGNLGKDYAYPPENITYFDTISYNGGLIIQTKNDTTYIGTDTPGRTDKWVVDLGDDASIVNAFVYVPYTWDSTEGIIPEWNITFNDVRITHVASFRDQSNMGKNGKKGYGLVVYDVSDLIQKGENIFSLGKIRNRTAVYPGTLVTIYNLTGSDAFSTIYMYNGADLLANTNNTAGRTVASNSLLNVGSLSNVKGAKLFVFAASAQTGEGNLIVNDVPIEDIWSGTSSSVDYYTFDLSDNLRLSNSVSFVATGSTIMALQQFIVVDSVAPSLSSDLQKLIDETPAGGTLNLSNVEFEDVSGIVIDKDISIVGDNAIINTAGDGKPVFNIASNASAVSISGIEFVANNGDVIVKANAVNGTDDLSIVNPAIKITGNKVSKANDDVVASSITLFKLESERAVLAPSNEISIGGNDLADGVKAFDFEITGLDNGTGIDIPQGGNINSNASGNGSAALKIATSIASSNMKTTTVSTAINGKNAGKNFTVTLKDSNGNALADKEVTISFNGKIYKVKTDSKGMASVKVALAKKGTYPVVITFLGDDKYNGTLAVAKVVVNPQKVKLTVAKKKYKASKKTKVLTATLKASNGKALKGKKLVFTVNGKKYTAKTNKKGIAKVKVKLSKKKTYKFTVKFAGDNTFKKISKKGKVVIK